MRLEKIQAYLKEKQWNYEYTEEDGLGSIDFEHRGLSYHIWEFEDGAYRGKTGRHHGELRTGDHRNPENLVRGKERKMFEIAR